MSGTPQAAAPVTPRRIAHLIEDLAQGGMENIVAHTARGQRDRGHEVSIVCICRGGKTAEDLKAEGFPVNIVGMRRARPVALYRLRRTLAPMRLDVAHLHGVPAGTFGRLALLGTGVRTLFHAQTQLSLAHAGLRSLGFRERLLARLPGAIVALSEGVRRDMVEQLGIREKRISVVHSGLPDLEPVEREPARARFGLGADEFVIVSPASLTENKGQEDLIEAIAGLEATRLLLGGKGPYEENLRAAVEARGLSDRVRFLGYVAEVGELLAAADVVAMASRWREGLSLSAIEALRAGRPAVVTDVGGLPEVVADRETGFVVPPNDPAAFTAAFTELQADDELRERLGRQARERFLRHFELNYYLAKLEELY